MDEQDTYNYEDNLENYKNSLNQEPEYYNEDFNIYDIIEIGA